MLTRKSNRFSSGNPGGGRICRASPRETGVSATTQSGALSGARGKHLHEEFPR